MTAAASTTLYFYHAGICSGKRDYLLLAVVPDGMFLSLISSQNSPFAPYTAMTFQQTSGTWYEYIQLKSGNHFAINDWNPMSAPHQVCYHIPMEPYIVLHCLLSLITKQSHSSDTVLTQRLKEFWR